MFDIPELCAISNQTRSQRFPTAALQMSMLLPLTRHSKCSVLPLTCPWALHMSLCPYDPSYQGYTAQDNAESDTNSRACVLLQLSGSDCTSQCWFWHKQPQLCLVAGGDDVYDDFAASHGRRHLSVQHYQHRKDMFYENKAFIEDWNAQADAVDSHMLKLNQFADWSEVRFLLYPPLSMTVQALLFTC